MKDKHEIRGPLVQALSQSPMLQFLGKHDPHGHELREMLTSGQLQQFSPGESIIKQGETGDTMYVLATGRVVISLDGAPLCTLSEPGDVFGEFGALTGELRSATVTAEDAVTAFALRGRLADNRRWDDSSMFSRLIQQALNKILLARLRRSNEERVELKKALGAVENQVVFLKMDNDVLKQQLDEARKELREGPRGTSTTTP